MRALAKNDGDYQLCTLLCFVANLCIFEKGNIDSNVLDNDRVELFSFLKDAHGLALAILFDF